MATTQVRLIENIMDKLDKLPVEFNILDTDVAPCLDDAMREMNVSLENIAEGSSTELYVEIRAQWYMLGRLQNSSSVNFRYSTGIDGKSVDKTSIPKTIGEIMDRLNSQFMQWYSTSFKSSTSGIWTKPQRTRSRLNG